jgi:phosphopantetheinyl transferase
MPSCLTIDLSKRQMPDIDDGAPTALCRVWLWQVVSSSNNPRSSHRRWPRVLRSHLAERCIAMALDIDAGSVRLSHHAVGKPVVLDPPQGRALSLSLSNSSSRLAIAVARTPNLGVDIEALHGRVIALEPLPWIAPSEAAAIVAASAAARRRHCLSIWTQKEAYLKVLGLGLGTRLADFEVEPNPNPTPSRPCYARYLEARFQRFTCTASVAPGCYGKDGCR